MPRAAESVTWSRSSGAVRAMSASACLPMPFVLGDAAVDSGTSRSVKTCCRFAICSRVSSAWCVKSFLMSADFAASASSPSAASESSSIVMAVRSWKRSRSSGVSRWVWLMWSSLRLRSPAVGRHVVDRRHAGRAVVRGLRPAAYAATHARWAGVRPRRASVKPLLASGNRS
ncbi:hypothetical protein ASD19_12820 [Microbacterium sp. Root53]|nr:hypothetical protein ASD19_12820 [Microbacterium sp. Root53]